MKNLKDLKGAKVLSKKEQLFLKGGKEYCGDGKPCNNPWDYCNGLYCVQLPPEMEP
ncbi:MAG: hypothetical protein AB7S69_07685 [Salinivirgaceae bacterium]